MITRRRFMGALAGSAVTLAGRSRTADAEPPPETTKLTLGRAAGCQVTIDDTYASQLHARVFQRDGQIFVEDIGSTNGTYLNRKKVTGPMVVQRGDQLQIGNTVLELGS